jgi:glycosyltransferase involved in cell wall biosynthesis
VPEHGLAIAQVLPFAWEAQTAVREHVELVSEELVARGHRVVVIAPSESSALVRESRRLLHGDPQALLERARTEPLVLGVGGVLQLAPNRRRAASLPVDVARTVEEAMATLPFDIVHVHEPYAPSASSVSLRHSRALNVATFHAPTERVLSTQLARPLSQLLFSRLDARIASYQATRELIARYFPGDYQVILPAAEPLSRGPGGGGGADVAPPPGPPRSHPGGPTRIVMIAEEERPALRLFLRALRQLPDSPDWAVTIWSQRPLATPATLSRRLRERVHFVDADHASAEATLAGADLAVFASEGLRPTPSVLVQALASGIVPVAPRLPVYEELLSDGSYGLVFEPRDIETLSAHLRRLVTDAALRQQLHENAALLRATLSYGRVVDELEGVYGRLTGRRHDRRPRDERARAAVRERPLIDVDLHMHTDHSYDCATPVEVLLAEAKALGLGAIAVTEHNEISGALEAATKARGIKVIVGEEVKTAEQGEVIGLFIREKIPRGMTLAETIAEIKRQGGLVYVPHPFDRMHSVPDYKNLLEVLDEIDLIEVFNPRVAIAEFNEEALRFASKYRMIAGAGSDAHVPQGLGSVRVRMRDFDGPQEFLESLRDADIVRNPASLLYVQALKFLQTKALPPSARKASRERRVRRVARGT